MIVVTGANGSVGRALVAALRERYPFFDVVPHDIETMDVTKAEEVRWILEAVRPRVIFHLAGAKHAPAGELDPFHVLNVNAMGTQNVLDAAGDAKVILASTCKACDPETAYGASKLVAERMVLNAGGVVVRYYNIRESDGNVFRAWEQIPESEPIPYTNCWRYFISMAAALDLTLAAMDLPSGRYTVDPGLSQHMLEVARRQYPRRETIEIPRRRGDRFKEPLHAVCEEMWRSGDFCEVRSSQDPIAERELMAA